MRIVLSGGTGLIGSALRRDWEAAGHSVDILTRGSASEGSLGPRTRALSWDAKSADNWWREADGCDALVHLAGEPIDGRWTPAKKERIRSSRLESGAAIVEAVARMQRPPRVLVQSSGVGYYGDGGDRELSEEDTPGDDFLGQFAGQWEGSTQPVEERGVRRVAIRTGLVLARNGGVLPRFVLPARWFVGGPLGSGRQFIPWIHLEDEVRAIDFLIGAESARGPFNLTAPNPVRNRDFTRAVARVLRRPHGIPAPAFALRALLGEMAELILGGQRAVPRRLLAAGFSFRFPDLEPALRDLLQPGGVAP